MLIAVITSLLVAATQTDALFTQTMPPPEVPTFEITMSGEEPFFAGIQIAGQWVTDYKMEIKPKQTVTLVVDSPFYWNAPFSSLRDKMELRYEPPAMRRERLENLWTSNGYTFLDTAAGWKPVKEADILLAERARNMTDAVQAKNTGQSTIAASFAVQETGSGLSPRLLLILRAVIILTGFLLAALAIKFILRRKEEWKALK